MEMEMAASAHLTLAAPANEKFTVRSAPARLPRRKPNAEYRSREHLTEREVERLIKAVKGNRWGHRDATMVLLAYGGIGGLRWDQQCALIFSMRLPSGISDTGLISGPIRQGDYEKVR